MLVARSLLASDVLISQYLKNTLTKLVSCHALLRFNGSCDFLRARKIIFDVLALPEFTHFLKQFTVLAETTKCRNGSVVCATEKNR